MARGYECDGCALTDFDLPDLVDPDLFFARVDEDGESRTLCNGCQQLPPEQRPVAWVGVDG